MRPPRAPRPDRSSRAESSAWGKHVVIESVEDPVVRHPPAGTHVSLVIEAESPIGVVIGEVDDPRVIAGTDPRNLS